MDDVFYFSSIRCLKRYFCFYFEFSYQKVDKCKNKCYSVLIETRKKNIKFKNGKEFFSFMYKLLIVHNPMTEDR